jgi:hypothetical protein
MIKEELGMKFYPKFHRDMVTEEKLADYIKDVEAWFEMYSIFVYSCLREDEMRKERNGTIKHVERAIQYYKEIYREIKKLNEKNNGV